MCALRRRSFRNGARPEAVGTIEGCASSRSLRGPPQKNTLSASEVIWRPSMANRPARSMEELGRQTHSLRQLLQGPAFRRSQEMFRFSRFKRKQNMDETDWGLRLFKVIEGYTSGCLSASVNHVTTFDWPAGCRCESWRQGCPEHIRLQLLQGPLADQGDRLWVSISRDGRAPTVHQHQRWQPRQGTQLLTTMPQAADAPVQSLRTRQTHPSNFTEHPRPKPTHHQTAHG
jgi:hypothetical protein